jgi:hypothetical protein
LFAAVDGPLAADRIVDAWERLDVPSRPLRSPRLALAAATAHRTVGAARTAMRRAHEGARSMPKGGRFETAYKFPPLTPPVVGPVVDAHRAALGRFTDVQVRVIGPRLLHLRRR